MVFVYEYFLQLLLIYYKEVIGLNRVSILSNIFLKSGDMPSVILAKSLDTENFLSNGDSTDKYSLLDQTSVLLHLLLGPSMHFLKKIQF